MFMNEQEWQGFCADQENWADFQRCNTEDSLQIRCQNMGLGTAEESQGIHPGVGSGTWGSLWPIPGFQLSGVFYPEGAQLQTPNLCKANQSFTGKGSFQSAAGPKKKCFHRCRLRLLYQHKVSVDIHLSALILTGKKSLKPEYTEVGEAFWMQQLPHTGKICTTQPLSQHSSLTRNKFKHGR